MGFTKQMHEQVGTEGLAGLLSQAAPYFSTIPVQFTEVRHAFATAVLKNVPEVRNHIQTVHAIAMCNLAEMVGGLVTDYALPEGRIWIPKGMTVRYVAKAKTDLIGTCDATAIDWANVLGDVTVPVRVRDTSGKMVFEADITMNVKSL